MKKHLINYETLLKITRSMSMCRDPEEVFLITVRSIKNALQVKGVALFLINPQSQELEVVASAGLSEDYLNKGPVSARHSIAASLKEGPVAIADVTDDPRLQYPDEAKKEGIQSILSVPIEIQAEIVGAMRIYTGDAWDLTLEDVNFIQALAQIAGILIDMSRAFQGQRELIEILSAKQAE